MDNGVDPRPAEILLVEDSPTDVLMTQEAFEQAKLLINLHVVEDGVEAMAFLRKAGPYGNAPRPDLILLDWNLPKKMAGRSSRRSRPMQT
jgi:two-component system response regulator